MDPIGFQHAPGKHISMNANQQPMIADLRLERGADSLDHPILCRGVEIGVHRQADDFLGQLVRYRNTVVDHRKPAVGLEPMQRLRVIDRGRECPAPSARRRKPSRAPGLSRIVYCAHTDVRPSGTTGTTATSLNPSA